MIEGNVVGITEDEGMTEADGKMEDGDMGGNVDITFSIEFLFSLAPNKLPSKALTPQRRTKNAQTRFC